MKEKPVFSTSALTPTQQKNKKNAPLTSPTGPTKQENKTIKMRLETKGRGGKSVTVFFDFSISEELIRDLGKKMQGTFGVGGTYKDKTIELRGDMRDRAESFLGEKGFKVIRAGG